MFIKGFRALAPGLEFRVWSALDGELPADLNECDAWLITGSRHDAYSDIPWIRRCATGSGGPTMPTSSWPGSASAIR
jgi:hypothetical protein